MRGGLSKDQLNAVATSNSQMPGLATKIYDNFDAIDTNKNGKVSKKELFAYNQSTNNSL